MDKCRVMKYKFVGTMGETINSLTRFCCSRGNFRCWRCFCPRTHFSRPTWGLLGPRLCWKNGAFPACRFYRKSGALHTDCASRLSRNVQTCCRDWKTGSLRIYRLYRKSGAFHVFSHDCVTNVIHAWYVEWRGGSSRGTVQMCCWKCCIDVCKHHRNKHDCI